MKIKKGDIVSVKHKDLNDGYPFTCIAPRDFNINDNIYHIKVYRTPKYYDYIFARGCDYYHVNEKISSLRFKGIKIIKKLTR